jgi:Fe-S oxidoreductase
MPGGLPKRTSRALLDIEDDKDRPGDPRPAEGRAPDYDGDAVFYFPGCGSERLFSQVGLATQAMLYHVGAQTVLPPGYLCCGYPQIAAGEADKGQKITTDNRVLFHRVANTLNYLDIKTVIVSCGTCMDQLQKYQFEKIFPGCRLLDIHEYLMEKGVKLDGVTGTRYMYHEPCHTPMKTHVRHQGGQRADGPARSICPTAAAANRHAGGDPPGHFDPGALPQAGGDREGRRRKLRADGFAGDVKMLTSCPSCLQGLSRYNDDAGTQADYIVVEMAKHLLGDNWMADYVARRPTTAASSASPQPVWGTPQRINSPARGLVSNARLRDELAAKLVSDSRANSA